ncbi:50S ribosomal protein L32 [candidate division WWE3 bacterium CG_4_9_14_3_um_filter_41_6]|uniref:Large ribosomal subunit protein bL32 n=1 Tax=candidate division WWE3 bacterium CG_4_10_14_0_2_um_filter_41_14 TaxID=1975072 RepID=A0A2M7TM86_UNCKA|nr:MAG: 50S ribosomal protein L32 [candidate division WWE3 bacterium CG_4_10_14_0_2_um_filter_41_14]PJA38854.1 MAG: 50S ribosomal protein L32 [candidate division WWE3 bacterium CG_4_9_14_3_um_filter_41_6]
MGALPKKKPSQTRRNSRHSAWEASVPTVKTVICETCKALTRPHRVCKNCGTYKGETVITKDTSVRKVSS